MSSAVAVLDVEVFTQKGTNQDTGLDMLMTPRPIELSLIWRVSKLEYTGMEKNVTWLKFESNNLLIQKPFQKAE